MALGVLCVDGRERRQLRVDVEGCVSITTMSTRRGMGMQRGHLRIEDLFRLDEHLGGRGLLGGDASQMTLVGICTSVIRGRGR